jgi:hypothetical protein
MVRTAIGPLLASRVKGFVFVATSGRSGSTTLQELFRCVPRSTALHEPDPRMNKEVLRAFNAGEDRAAFRIFTNNKLPRILWSARYKHWYFETNHMFIKCFADAAVHHFRDRIQVVHLVRDPLAVANSFFRRPRIPGTPEGNDWLLDPAAVRNLIRTDRLFEPGQRFCHDYYKCLWYWYETEARTAAFRATYPHVPVHRIETEQLNDLEAVTALFERLGVPVAAALADAVGLRANVHKGGRPTRPEGIDEEDLQAFQHICQSRLEAITGEPRS